VNFLLDNWHWLAAAVTSGIALLWPNLMERGSGSAINTQTAIQLINREKGLVIDVSDAAERAQGYIVGSRHIALPDLGTTKSLPSNKATPLIVVSGKPAVARQALKSLAQLGFQRVHILSGGMAAWRAENLPIEKSA
jgi:rhodanese-related sulfurtransferase